MRKKSFRIISEIQQGGTEISSKMCNISRITSANCTPEKKECSVAVNYSPNMLKTIWSESCWGRRRASRSALEWKMSSGSFWPGKRNSPSTGISEHSCELWCSFLAKSSILCDCSHPETPLSMSLLSALCQLCHVNFLNSARLPCAARWDCLVADPSIELPMALTQTVFLFYNVPVAISP